MNAWKHWCNFALIGSIAYIILGRSPGGSIFGKFQGVPNFWVLLHFYALISKKFPISVGRRGRGDQTPGESLPPQLMHLCNWNCFTEILQIRANCFQVSHKNYKIALHGKSNECQLSGTVIKVEIWMLKLA